MSRLLSISTGTNVWECLRWGPLLALSARILRPYISQWPHLRVHRSLLRLGRHVR